MCCLFGGLCCDECIDTSGGIHASCQRGLSQQQITVTAACGSGFGFFGKHDFCQRNCFLVGSFQCCDSGFHGFGGGRDCRSFFRGCLFQCGEFGGDGSGSRGQRLTGGPKHLIACQSFGGTGRGCGSGGQSFGEFFLLVEGGGCCRSGLFRFHQFFAGFRCCCPGLVVFRCDGNQCCFCG